MSHQSLFTPSFLKDRLKTFRVEESFSDFARKKLIIEGWINGIKTGVILSKKETSLDADFMNEIFGEVLGYHFDVKKGKWNLEKKFSISGKEADGVLGYFANPVNDLFDADQGKRDLLIASDVRVIIELKSFNTDLDKKQNRIDRQTPVEQAFSYANKAGEACKWIIVSNFNEIRLYNKNIGEERYESFFISQLEDEYQLKRFFYILGSTRLFLEKQKSIIESELEKRQQHLQSITKTFYSHYKQLRLELFEHLRKENLQFKNRESILLEKTQKILDRMLFICFCEWMNITEPYLLQQVVENAEKSFGNRDDKLWNELKNLYQSLDKGLPPRIHKFNGGLFKEDNDLDGLMIKDWILYRVLDLRKYDYSNDLTIDILGHIFEQSISDIEEIHSKYKSQLDLAGGQSVDPETLNKKDSQRKKDGIFYTPEYITTYIVNEALGGWLDDRKKELGFYDLPELTDDEKDNIKYTKQGTVSVTKQVSRKSIDKIKKHTEFWLHYRDAVRNVKVLDPACGSGAFLVKVFDYLKKEFETINKALAELRPGALPELFDLDKHILTNNIFGVDLNPASVEITQLSLWLKTADRSKELTTLDKNIQCGNSLIDDVEIAGDAAFNWEKRFPQVFRKPLEKQTFKKETAKSLTEDYPQKDTLHENEKSPDSRDIHDEFHEPGADYGNLSNAGFDVIVGNPPYVPIEMMSLKDKEFFKRKYFQLERKFDSSIVFILKSLELLKDTGYLSFISSVTWQTGENYNRFREFLVEEKGIKKIVNLPFNIFEDAYVDTCIYVISNTKVDDYEIYNFGKKEAISNLANITFEKIHTKDILSRNYKIILSDKSNLILEKINALKDIIRLGDITVSTQGLTGSRFEKLPTAIENYFPFLEKGVLHRYSLMADKVSYVSLENHKTLSQFYEAIPKLLIRRIISRQDRLLVGYTDQKFLFTKDINPFICINQEFDTKFLLGILNSKLISFLYLNSSSIATKDDFRQTTLAELRNLPIPKCSIEMQKPIIIKSDSMLFYINELNEIKKKFLKYLISDFKLEEPSNKLKNWVEFNWKEIELELIKFNRRVRGQDKEEWIERFERFKAKAEIIQATIKATDEEIDEMVFELYGLSKEEIEIVKVKDII